VFLAGCPGTGKSLASMTLATAGMPIITFKMGSTKSKYVGESGQNFRAVLALAEALAPCILRIDEIDKAMSTGGNGGLEGHTVELEQLGTLLSWMQDHRDNNVFVVATANYVSGIDPALLNRFDRSFFVDFPTTGERQDIAAIHIRKKDRSPADYDLPAIAAASAGYNGREIEQCINGALLRAFQAGEKLHTRHIVAELGDIIPLSVTMAPQIDAMKKWASNANPVSSQQQTGRQATTAASSAQVLELD